MKRHVRIRRILIVTALIVCLQQMPVSAAGKFDFNDGTVQGWSLDQMYVTATQIKFSPTMGYQLANSNGQLSANAGSLLIGRSDQNDFYLESPNLSANAEWQNITGYSLDVRRTLYSPCWGDFATVFYFQLQMRVIDTADGNKEKLFAESDGTSFIFHDIKTRDQLYHFTWIPSWLADARYKVKSIRFRITEPGDVAAECWYRGGWEIDNVTAQTAAGSSNTPAGGNVQIGLGSGVTMTFDNVSAPGTTALTTSSSGTPPLEGFAILPAGSPMYYSITTTASTSGYITICIQYSDAGLTAAQETALKLYVYETPPGQWRDITISLNTSTNIICGKVSHLSEFAVMVPGGGSAEDWVLMNDPNSGGINCFTAMGENLYAGTEGGGVLQSVDNGNTWNPSNSGLTNSVVRALCTAGSALFAGTWGDGIFISTDNGTSWKSCNVGLSNLAVTTLYSKGTNLLAGTWGGGVFLSTEDGSNWTEVNSGISETHMRSLYISESAFYAGSINGLFFSTSNGANWIATNNGLTNTAALSLASIPGNSGEQMFVGTQSAGVFSSEGNGANWTAVTAGLTTLQVPFLCAAGNRLYAATWGGGVFMTADQGQSWAEDNKGLTDANIRTLIVSGKNIFAGSENGGIWRKPLPAKTFIVIDGFKDDFYKTLTGPSDGYLQLRSYAYNDNGKPANDEDLSAKIWMAWDQQCFYLYEEVKDDTLAGNSPAVWEEDCLELKFDPQPTDSVSNSVWDTRMTALGMETPGVIWENNLYNIPEEQKQWVRRQIPGGYVLEFAFPWSFIQSGSETITPEVGNEFGMAIGQNDNDGRGYRQATVQWAAVLKDAVWNTPKYHGTVRFLEGNKLEFFAKNKMTGRLNPIPYDGSDYTPTRVKETPKVPTRDRLVRNYPNPFNPTTTIEFEAARSCEVTLKVYDILGREVAVMAKSRYDAGRHSIQFDASGLPSGIYIYRIGIGDFVAAGKMVKAE